MQVTFARLETRYGNETRAYIDPAKAEAWRQEIAAENWDSIMFSNDDKPEDPEELANAYFERAGDRDEFFGSERIEVIE